MGASPGGQADGAGHARGLARCRARCLPCWPARRRRLAGKACAQPAAGSRQQAVPTPPHRHTHTHTHRAPFPHTFSRSSRSRSGLFTSCRISLARCRTFTPARRQGRGRHRWRAATRSGCRASSRPVHNGKHPVLAPTPTPTHGQAPCLHTWPPPPPHHHAPTPTPHPPWSLMFGSLYSKCCSRSSTAALLCTSPMTLPGPCLIRCSSSSSAL